MNIVKTLYILVLNVEQLKNTNIATNETLGKSKNVSSANEKQRMFIGKVFEKNQCKTSL